MASQSNISSRQDASERRRPALQDGLQCRDGDLHHGDRALGQRLKMLGAGVVQQCLGLLLVQAVDADFRLDDRHLARESTGCL
jgi:hypothetical protein